MFWQSVIFSVKYVWIAFGIVQAGESWEHGFLLSYWLSLILILCDSDYSEKKLRFRVFRRGGGRYPEDEMLEQFM